MEYHLKHRLRVHFPFYHILPYFTPLISQVEVAWRRIGTSEELRSFASASWWKLGDLNHRGQVMRGDQKLLFGSSFWSQKKGEHAWNSQSVDMCGSKTWICRNHGHHTGKRIVYHSMGWHGQKMVDSLQNCKPFAMANRTYRERQCCFRSTVGWTGWSGWTELGTIFDTTILTIFWRIPGSQGPSDVLIWGFPGGPCMGTWMQMDGKSGSFPWWNCEIFTVEATVDVSDVDGCWLQMVQGFKD